MKRLLVITCFVGVMLVGCDAVPGGSYSVYQSCFGHVYDCSDVTPTPQHITSKKTNITPKVTDYYMLAREDADLYGINETIFTRQIYQESKFNTSAVSPSGAVGIAQFLPSTAASIGINPWNAEESLRGAAYLDSTLLKKYGTYDLMLASYNGGGGTVDYCLRAYGDEWFTCVPIETRSYVTSILHQ